MFKYEVGQVVLYRDTDGWEYAIILERWESEYGHRFYVLDVPIEPQNENFLRQPKRP